MREKIQNPFSQNSEWGNRAVERQNRGRWKRKEWSKDKSEFKKNESAQKSCLEADGGY